MLSALTREEFDAALRDAQPSKRGRPPKAAAEREAALAERARRKANAWQRPEDWPLLQPTPNLLASETAKVGRPRRVLPMLPLWSKHCAISRGCSLSRWPTLGRARRGKGFQKTRSTSFSASQIASERSQAVFGSSRRTWMKTAFAATP